MSQTLMLVREATAFNSTRQTSIHKPQVPTTATFSLGSSAL